MPRIAARTFEDLIVWQEAHEFVLETYRFSMHFPRQIYEFIRSGQSPFRNLLKINYDFWLLYSGGINGRKQVLQSMVEKER